MYESAPGLRRDRPSNEYGAETSYFIQTALSSYRKSSLSRISSAIQISRQVKLVPVADGFSLNVSSR
jgi:hypothetical protein